jgi:endo-1,4-beta-xylanase
MSTGQVHRRDVIAGLGAAAAIVVLPWQRAHADAPSLAAAARASRLFYGAAVQEGQLKKDDAFAALVAAQCGVVVPEWEMKWAAIEHRQGRRNFARADAIRDFATRQRLKIRGHTLIWHRSIPDWAKEAFANGNGWPFVHDHIAAMLARYGVAPFIHWDVLNEVIEPKQGRADGLRVSPFLKAFGPDYIERALRLARDSAPATRLYINEYGVDYDGRTERDRRAALLRLVQQLKSKGVPLDGVGIQAHLRLDGSPFSAVNLRRFLADVAGTGVRIAITELDVRERDLTPPIAARDARVADEVKRYLDVVLQEPALDGVVTWGLSDRYSWLTSTAVRAQGTVNRGLPFDSDLAPKPVRDTIVAMLAQRKAAEPQARAPRDATQAAPPRAR